MEHEICSSYLYSMTNDIPHVHTFSHLFPHLSRGKWDVPFALFVRSCRQYLLQYLPAVAELLLALPHHSIHKHHDAIGYALQLVLVSCRIRR